MGEKKVRVYICSSVGIDYFSFLGKTLERAGIDPIKLFLISEGDYRKLAKSTGLKKVWLRIQMYILYPLYLCYKALTCRSGSVFVVTSNTFFAPWLTQVFLRLKKGKVIHLLYDLFPDALEIAGAIPYNSGFARAIGKIISITQKQCAATVYLGEFLSFHAQQRWGKARRSTVIDISTDIELYTEPFFPSLGTAKLIIHYGGQLGHLHDAESIIDAVKYIYESDIARQVEFNFYVSGAQAQFLESSLKQYPVKIISAIPSHQWRIDISRFHLGIVSLAPGGATVCLPSKTYGMMAGGMAILAICPEWSDLAELVRKNDTGWVINNSNFSTKEELYGDEQINPEKLKEQNDKAERMINFYETVKYILDHPEILAKKRTNAYEGMRAHFNIDLLSTKWKKLIDEIR